jgi:hypothetical protein
MAYTGNLLKYRKADITKVVTSAGGTTASGKTQVGDTWDFANLHQKTLVLQSWGPSVFTTAILEYSPDKTFWGTYDGTSLQNLGSGLVKKITMENSIRYWKLSVEVGSVTSTCTATWDF